MIYKVKHIISHDSNRINKVSDLCTQPVFVKYFNDVLGRIYSQRTQIKCSSKIGFESTITSMLFILLICYKIWSIKYRFKYYLGFTAFINLSTSS